MSDSIRQRSGQISPVPLPQTKGSISFNDCQQRQVLADKGLTNAPVMGYLDYIRDVRNTADHPDTTFNQIEAEQALIQATNAIRELDKLKSTSAKTSNQ